MLATAEALRATNHEAADPSGPPHASRRAVGTSVPQQPRPPIALPVLQRVPPGAGFPAPPSPSTSPPPDTSTPGHLDTSPGLKALSDYDRTALFHEFLRADRPLYDLAERHALSPEQLEDFINSPLTRKRIEIYERLADRQAAVVAALARPAALGALKGLLDAHHDDECNQLVSPDHGGFTLQHRRRDSARRTAARLLTAAAAPRRSPDAAPPESAPAAPAPGTPGSLADKAGKALPSIPSIGAAPALPPASQFDRAFPPVSFSLGLPRPFGMLAADAGVPGGRSCGNTS